MKKILIVLMGLMVSTAAMAQVQSMAQMTFYGGVGAAIASGDMVADPNYEEPKAEAGSAYNFGATFGFFLNERGALMLGLSYLAKDLKVKWVDVSAGTGDLTATYKTRFINLSIGYRGYTNLVFWGFGGFYGFKSGTWEGEFKFEDNADIKGDLKDEITKDDYGIYLELGVSLPINEQVSIDLSGRFDIGIPKIIDQENTAELRGHALMLNGGLTFKF